METAAAFLESALAACPFKVEKILTDNGTEFTYNALAEGNKPKGKAHPFGAVCGGRQIEHRTTLARHPWTNGMAGLEPKRSRPTPPSASTTNPRSS
jgi:hypothetical protein